MARMLEDTRWDLPEWITTPSALVEVSEAQKLNYVTAASFVRYLSDRFGMPALLELYAALDGVDAQGTPGVFLAVLGVDWDDIESRYFATYMLRVLEVVSDPDAIARVLHGARAPPRPPPPGQVLMFP